MVQRGREHGPSNHVAKIGGVLSKGSDAAHDLTLAVMKSQGRKPDHGYIDNQ
jgi:hypothetical protein